MDRISSLQNPTIKLIRSLREKKHRHETGLFVAEGVKVIARARQEGWVAESLVYRGEAPPGFEGARLIEASDKVMASLSAQANPSDVIGVFRQRFRDELPLSGAHIWVVLDAIRDPGNLGTIIRTADAVGQAGVALVGQSCDPWSPDCVRATMGSIFAVPLARLSQKTLERAVQEWPGEIVATATAATEDYRRIYRPPVLLMMGSEGRGLAPALAGLAHVQVRIPMAGSAESLNLAVATALMLYEVRRPILT